MSLSSVSIRRPVLAIVMSLVILLFGIISFRNLGVREYPSVDVPIITVQTSYTGANADVMESQITEPLEESINGIQGIRSLSSVSREGRSTITVEFTIDVDLETAANDVRDRVARSLRSLPADMDPPVVAKADADASAIVMVSLESSSKNLLELTDIATNVLKERVQTIPGVSTVQIWGEKKYSMKLQLDPAKMVAYSITPLDVKSALNKENIELPAGRVEGSATELTVRTLGRLTTVEDFNNMIIKDANGALVKLRDIGYAALMPENERTLLKRDGVPMVGLGIIPQPGSNYIQIANEFHKKLAEIKKELPKDVTVKLGFDITKFIRESITEVEQTIYIAFGMVILVIYFFLRNWRTTVIPIFAIPISLVGTFFIMYISGFSINVLTMLGIVLAIGIVVDDAIVVLENIYTKIEEGMTPYEAAEKGSQEIFFAIISTTVSLASVFIPIIFLKGITGKLFKEFAFVLSGSVIISAFVSLTLTPMLSAKMLRKEAKHSRFYELTEPFFVWMISLYKNSLDKFMEKRWLAFVVIAISFVIIFFAGGALQSELAPLEDRSAMRISSITPEGSSFAFMENYLNKIEKVVAETVTERDAVIAMTAPGFGSSSSVNTSNIRLMLVNPDERTRSQQEIALDLTQKLTKYNDARTFIIQEQTIGTARGGLPVQYILQAPTLDKLKIALPKFLDEARKDPSFSVIDFNLKFNKPELIVEINRYKARELGVSAGDIAQTIQLAYSEQRFGFFILNGKQYQVIGQMKREDRSKPLDLKSISVKNKGGELIQLDNFIRIRENSTPPQLYRFNRYVSATVSANLAPGKTIGDGITAMDKIAKKVLDESFSTALDGPSKDFAESSSSLAFTFILALILIYLVLAAQFESFLDPLTIMFTVPLAIAGAVGALWYFNQTMNIFSQIGQIMLIGLVTKNGILIVEFANQRKEQGLDYLTAVKEASVQRFRPILMTSLTAILGTLPIALALGAGSQSRVSMGIAIIGGLVFSTFLTLYVVPAIYSYLTGKKGKQ